MSCSNVYPSEVLIIIFSSRSFFKIYPLAQARLILGWVGDTM